MIRPTPLFRSIVMLALAGAGSAALACDPIPDGPAPKCDVDEFAQRTKEEDRCKTSSCLPWNSAPGPVVLDCTRTLRGFSCAAWPRSVDGEMPLSYRFSGSGNIWAGSTAETLDPIRVVSCGNGVPSMLGTLTVEVISPFGLSASTSIGLDCRQTSSY